MKIKKVSIAVMLILSIFGLLSFNFTFAEEIENKVDHNVKGMLLFSKKFPWKGYTKITPVGEEKELTSEEAEGYTKITPIQLDNNRSSYAGYDMKYSFVKSASTKEFYLPGEDICFKTLLHGNYNSLWDNRMKVTLKRSINWWFDDTIGTKYINLTNSTKKLRWNGVGEGDYYLVLEKQYNGEWYYDENAAIDNCGFYTDL